MINPAIVINAYNRPKSLERLLRSISDAHFVQEVTLHISLEYEPHVEVVRLVESFEKPNIVKIVERQPGKLGLVNHFLYCGSLSKRYGAIIYLEDDLFVGPQFYAYAQSVLKFYQDESKLAGFSLNALWFNGYLHTPFRPLDDGGDAFFLQVPWFQGQIYTSQQWAHFEGWLNEKKELSGDLMIHDMFRNYKLDEDWFPLKTRYLIETERYYCFPRSAHCVNFGDEGVHFSKSTNFFQTELCLSIGVPFYKSFDESLAVYDSFYELLPSRIFKLAPDSKLQNAEIDINGTKNLNYTRKDYVLTSKPVKSFEQSFGLEMRPPELNIKYEIPGNQIFLAKKENVKRTFSGTPSKKNFEYNNRMRVTTRMLLRLMWWRLLRIW